MSIKTNRAIAAAAAASIALTTLTLTPAAAEPFYAPTEVHYRDNGGAAALGAFAAIAGTIATIAAAEHYRRHYDEAPYPYAYRPAYPAYGYGGYGGYDGGWRRWHRHW